MSNPKEHEPRTAVEEMRMRIETIRAERSYQVESQERAEANVLGAQEAIRNCDALIRQYEVIIAQQ